jgi:hypothetical protein
VQLSACMGSEWIQLCHHDEGLASIFHPHHGHAYSGISPAAISTREAGVRVLRSWVAFSQRVPHHAYREFGNLRPLPFHLEFGLPETGW